MPTVTTRSILALALACCAAAAPASAQSSARDRARAERERREREQWEQERAARTRAERERVARLERERQLREAQLDRARRERETQLARQRRELEARMERTRREREAQLRARQQRQRRLYDDRPRLTLSGGIDIREFDGPSDRYVVQGGVDFRARSGLGMRPEVTYAWTDRGPGSQIVTDATGRQIGIVDVSGRTRALGLMLNATYTFFRTSAVRPYLLGGPGIVSTRIASMRSTGPALVEVPSRHELDFGLNTGAGLEFVVGPVRLFTEARYFLTDTPVARGFSGMVPITAGVRF